MLDLIEEHENDLNAHFTDAVAGPLSYIQYHKAETLPDNFVAVGDAVMKLNPIYGMMFHLGLHQILGLLTSFE